MKWLKDRLSPGTVRKIIYGSGIALVCFAIIGFFILPPIIKSVLIKNLSEKLHRTVTVRKVAVNPFVLSVDIEGIMVSERGKPDAFVSLEQLHLNLEAVSLIKRGLIMKEIRIVNPSVRINRDGENHYNFSDLLEEGKTQTPADAKGARGFRFSLNNIEIQNGSIDFKDGPKNTDHKVREINVRIPFLSNFSYYLDSYVKPSFSAKVNDRQVSFQGMTKPFADSLETSFDINIKELDIPYYLAYLPMRLDYKISSALLDVRTVVSFVQYKSKTPAITLSGDIDLLKVRITDLTGGPLLDLPALRLSVARADLATRAVHLTRLGIEALEVDLIRKKDGSMNVDVLRPGATPAAKDAPASREPKQAGGSGFSLDIDEIRLTGGKVLFTDLSTSAAFKTRIEPIEISLDHFNTVKEKRTAVAFSAKTEAGEELKVIGEMSLEPLTAEGRAEVVHVPLKRYAPYYADRLLFSIEDAVLDLSGKYSYAKKEGAEDPVVRLADISTTLRNLKLRKKDEKEDFLKLPEFTLSGGAVDVGGREITLDKISSRSGALALKRAADGKMNILTLLAPQQAAPSPKTGPAKAQKPGKAEKEWLYTVADLRLDDFSVKYSDHVPADPVELSAERIRIAAGKISNRKGSIGNASVSLLMGKKGSLSANGSLGINPLSSKMQVSLRSMELFPFQAYITERTNVIITDGAVSASGSVSVARAADGLIKAGYQGEVSVSGLRTVDSINTDELVSWNNLSINGIDAGYNPLRWHVKEVALTEFYTRLIINPNGSLNLQEVLKPPPAPGETPSVPATAANAPASAPATVATAAPAATTTTAPAVAVSQKAGIRSAGIDTITLQGGTVQFSDFYIKPNYSARIVELGGRVSGLSSDETAAGDLNLKGKVDNYAPLEISGKINPLRDDLFVDIKAVVKDVDLSPVTPYSGRYAGYTIQKGKLSLDLNYHIEKKKLEADNRIFLDQFTFGDQVESPDATKLPVKLAVALLKNRKGEIRLEIPVSGYINDPKFSVGRIVLKIIVNLLVKAATSPFALLGALFGGGEELSFIDYEAGSSAVNEPGAKKLDTLIKALSDRPSLKLEIEGHVDTEKDREGLRKYAFERKLKAQKLKELVKKGVAASPVDEIKIETAEYPVYLKMAYKDEKFPKPRNVIGIAKDLPVPEMEKLMLTHIEIKEDDLRRLASQRALNVREKLVQSGKLEPERVFLVEPKALAPEKKEGLSNSRVDFRLK
ncbi:MAG: DUF748 domain-containing protein [Nitrospirae bacterium]|nr:MAG: DUF748 domain-containing protein [Nitrospirota bacterium]